MFPPLWGPDSINNAATEDGYHLAENEKALVRARSRDVLLPILLYPLTVPVIIAGVRGTAALLQPEPDLASARVWLSLLVSFDVVFITLALWTFEPLMTD